MFCLSIFIRPFVPRICSFNIGSLFKLPTEIKLYTDQNLLVMTTSIIHGYQFQKTLLLQVLTLVL